MFTILWGKWWNLGTTTIVGREELSDVIAQMGLTVSMQCAVHCNGALYNGEKGSFFSQFDNPLIGCDWQ